MSTPLPSSSYEASVSAAIATMLSNCVHFQAWTGTSTPADALAWLIEDDGGDGVVYATNNVTIDTSAGNWASIRLLDTERVARAALTWGHTGSATITLVERITASDKPPEVIRRARNNAGLIQADFQALFSQAAGYIVAGEIRVGTPIRQDAVGALQGCVVTELTLSWRDIP